MKMFIKTMLAVAALCIVSLNLKAAEAVKQFVEDGITKISFSVPAHYANGAYQTIIRWEVNEPLCRISQYPYRAITYQVNGKDFSFYATFNKVKGRYKAHVKNHSTGKETYEASADQKYFELEALFNAVEKDFYKSNRG